MATLGDFSSVLEVGFAVNGLLIYLEIDPAHRSRLGKLTSAIDDLRQQCNENGIKPQPVSGDVSTEWAFQWIFRMHRQFWQRLTVVMSAIALALLVWGAYSPTTNFPWWLSAPIVFSLYAVPLRSFLICRRIEQELENNIFDNADALGIKAKDFMSSKGIIPRRPSDL